MALSDLNRTHIWERIMREQSDRWGALTRADLKAAVVAVDDFFYANATAINTAFPQPARAELTAKQKAMIVGYVALRRWEV